MELIIKGDGSVFRPFDKGYRNHLWRMRCGILWTAFYAALSGLRCLVFQPVHGGYIRIEGTCSPAETFFIGCSLAKSYRRYAPLHHGLWRSDEV